ncbi:MAG: hypothetical protein JSR83_07095 [Proteobacteria bacterium]|nr:hypothetical protein [Pseudomonadota bacterium]
MATLREQLAQLYPTILPTDPTNPIKGTELLTVVKSRLDGEYADQTIRQHFSVMSAEPTSAIAKVSQGYGYYLRPAPINVVAGGNADGPFIENPLPATPAEIAGTRNHQREEKFRALYQRYETAERNSFPVHIEHTTAARQAAGVNKWKFPDVVLLNWEVGKISDSGYQIDRGLLEVKRSLGDQPFRLTSVELKVELSLSSFREHFFQCVSNSKWAHHAQLVAANAIQDETLVMELRRLGTSFDISVLSFGLTNEILDAMPPSNEIISMKEKDLEQWTSKVNMIQISSGRPREALDWEHIEDVRKQSSDFNEVFAWISKCLVDAKVYSFKHYKELNNIQSAYE